MRQFIVILLLGLLLRWQNGTITEISNDTVTVETEDGNLWDFYSDGYEIDQQVTVYFNTKGTETIYDDEIIIVE